MGKTIAIIGAGPEIGMSLARRFGREGYKVGLVSRTQSKLDGYAAELRGLGVEAVGCAADVTDRPALEGAIGQIKSRLGSIDVLEYSPLIEMTRLIDVLQLKPEDAARQFEFAVYGAITAVRAVLPDMIAKGDGAILMTLGASSHVPAPSHSDGSLGVTALRQYMRMLHAALKHKGVYVGGVVIGQKIVPDSIADIYWNLTQSRDVCEHLWGDPRLMAAYEDFVTMGIGAVFPPALIGELPAPADERQRTMYLISLFHIWRNVRARQGEVPELERLASLAEGIGGDRTLPYFGADADLFHPPIVVQ